MSGGPQEDTFQILLATDVHLGYAEKDSIRGQDSYNSFEEILRIAQQYQVDFILLGGDLFHEAKPSPYCIFRCSELLRKYCFGDKPISIEILSDQSHNFRHQTNPTVNYEDPNLNIAIPVFSIHGNHDDPSGHANVSALDIIASSGLINYFGKYDDLEKVEISPILLKKGASHLALYGLSHIRDERLGRMFRDGKVTFDKMPDDRFWFNLFVLHQNRAERGRKNFIPETCLPDFLHLVMWGHEHDCRIEPTETVNGVHITQPGSSVATSLTDGEAITKKVAVLKVCEDRFHVEPIELKTVRPFIFERVWLKDPGERDFDHGDSEKQSERMLTGIVQKMLVDTERKQAVEGRPQMLPLIRLVVYYHVEKQIVNHIKFGQKYTNKVANPEEMVVMKPVRAKETRKRMTAHDESFDGLDEVEGWCNAAEDIVKNKIRANRLKGLKVLSLKGLTEAVKRYIELKDEDAIPLFLSNQMDEAQKTLVEQDVDPAALKTYFETINMDHEADEARDFQHVWKFKAPARNNAQDEEDVLDDDDEDFISDPSPTRGKGSRGGRGSRKPRGESARGRGSREGRGAANKTKLF